jgi:hypothetical protein
MKVLTAVVNNPIFIEIQYYTLKKYMKTDYEFIVFNDAKPFPDFTNGNDVSIREQIIDLCAKLNIKCVNIENSHHMQKQNASQRTADSCNIMLQFQIQNPDQYLVLDSDMFLIDDFYLDHYLKYDCAIVLQSRNNFTTHYFWNGLYYFDTTKMQNMNLLNWDCTNILSLNCDENHDTGGAMQTWLSCQTDYFPNTDDIRKKDALYVRDDVYFIRHLWSCSWDESELPLNLKNHSALLDFMKTDPRNQCDKFFCEIYDNMFLHYRAGGNWKNEGLDLHIALANKLKNTVC